MSVTAIQISSVPASLIAATLKRVVEEQQAEPAESKSQLAAIYFPTSEPVGTFPNAVSSEVRCNNLLCIMAGKKLSYKNASMADQAYSPSTWKNETHAPSFHGHEASSADKMFEEALRDAMADEEGAEYWEGVYGQPLHTYGDKATMTDEEYAAYVRAQMYKKTQAGKAEEIKERMEKRREADTQEKEKKAERDYREAQAHARRMHKHRVRDSRNRPMAGTPGQHGYRGTSHTAHRTKSRGYSVGRGEKGTYFYKYQHFYNSVQRARDSHTPFDKSQLPDIVWPVLSGKVEDITTEAVRKFVDRHHVTYGGKFEMIRQSRVFWHPDKVQQMYGQQSLTKQDLDGITAVSQAMNDLWITQKDLGMMKMKMDMDMDMDRDRDMKMEMEMNVNIG